VLDLAALAASAEAVGAMESLNAVTLSHLRTRRQFGVSIGSFQVLQHHMVDMTIRHREAAALINAAAAALDGKKSNARWMIHASKALASRAGRIVGELAVQLHGGMGMTDELAVGHYFKRLLSIGATFGDAASHFERMTAEKESVMAEDPCTVISSVDIR
jgi:alkylation response protein AidB-like acyl-CoA dehydrogenase